MTLAVSQGLVLYRPQLCPEYMYEMMLLCWSRDPVNRPTFTELLKTLDEKISSLPNFKENSNQYSGNFYWNPKQSVSNYQNV